MLAGGVESEKMKILKLFKASLFQWISLDFCLSAPSPPHVDTRIIHMVQGNIPGNVFKQVWNFKNVDSVQLIS